MGQINARVGKSFRSERHFVCGRNRAGSFREYIQRFLDFARNYKQEWCARATLRPMTVDLIFGRRARRERFRRSLCQRQLLLQKRNELQRFKKIFCPLRVFPYDLLETVTNLDGNFSAPFFVAATSPLLIALIRITQGGRRGSSYFADKVAHRSRHGVWPKASAGALKPTGHSERGASSPYPRADIEPVPPRSADFSGQAVTRAPRREVGTNPEPATPASWRAGADADLG